jgi:hypothetical protein
MEEKRSLCNILMGKVKRKETNVKPWAQIEG